MSDFASGKHAWALCQRCGLRFDYREIRAESGTQVRVCRECDDGRFNRVEHPQNGPFPVTPDPQALRWAFPDTDLAVDVSASEGLPIPLGGNN
jgi:hypothetical protein